MICRQYGSFTGWYKDLSATQGEGTRAARWPREPNAMIKTECNKRKGRISDLPKNGLHPKLYFGFAMVWPRRNFMSVCDFFMGEN